MFDIGWPELFIVGLLTLIVVGPKDLPRVLRTVTGVVRKVKGMAREFQNGIDEVVRESELEDMRKEIEAQGLDMRDEVVGDIDPTGDRTGELDFSEEKAAIEAAVGENDPPGDPALDAEKKARKADAGKAEKKAAESAPEKEKDA